MNSIQEAMWNLWELLVHDLRQGDIEYPEAINMMMDNLALLNLSDEDRTELELMTITEQMKLFESVLVDIDHK